MRLYKLSRVNVDRIADIGNVVTTVVIAETEQDARVLAAGEGILMPDFLVPKKLLVNKFL